jgi:HEPN domain-containing protein
MDDAMRHEIEQWLLKSQRDLRAARLLFESEEALLDVVVYHCQQAAEKALKAYLTYQNVVFQKTHDLDVLINLCLPFNVGFKELRETAITLTPYAVEFRYPGNAIEPERVEANQALEMAESVLNFVRLSLFDEGEH